MMAKAEISSLLLPPERKFHQEVLVGSLLAGGNPILHNNVLIYNR